MVNILVQLALLSYSSYLECLGNLSGWYYFINKQCLDKTDQWTLWILCGSSQGCSIALITVTPRKNERWPMINSQRLWSQHCSLNYRKVELQLKCFVLLYFMTFAWWKWIADYTQCTQASRGSVNWQCTIVANLCQLDVLMSVNVCFKTTSTFGIAFIINTWFIVISVLCKLPEYVAKIFRIRS